MRRIVLAVALLLVSTASAEAKRGPIDAKVSLDASRTSSARITVAGGGTLAVRARNGTKMTVSFPAHAVPQDTQVTATAVTKLASRRTRRGLLAGVQLQPEGLQLQRAAKVRFTRDSKPPKGAALVFMGSEGDGGDIYRLPPPARLKGTGSKRHFVTTGRPVVSIAHFSTVEGFDWSKATLSEINAILYPALGIHRMSQELSKILGDKDATIQDFLEAHDRVRAQFVEPVLDQALAAVKTTCSVKALRSAQVALKLGLGFARQMQLLGLESNVSQLFEIMDQSARCMVGLCPTLGDPTAGTFLLGLAREMQLLGIGDEAFHAALVDNMFRCSAFELRLDSTITLAIEGGGWTYRLLGVIKVVPSPDTFGPDAIRPRGALEYASTSGSQTLDCETTTVVGTTNGAFQLSDLQMNTFNPDKPAADPIRKLEVAVIGGPLETYHTRVSAPCTYTVDDEQRPFWFVGFGTEHDEFIFPGADFAPDEAPVFAIATYGPNPKPFAGGTVTENLKIEIVHTPQPATPMPDAG